MKTNLSIFTIFILVFISQNAMSVTTEELKKGLGIDVEKLRSFELIVFPKVTGIEARSNKQFIKDSTVRKMSKEERQEYFNSNVEFGKPRVYSFRAVELQSCYKLIKNRPKYKPQKFFGKAELYKEDQKKKCMVLQIKRDPELRRSQVKKDDILATRVFLDENFAPYGKSLDIANRAKRKEVRTAEFRLDSKSSLSSELSYLPLDLPNLNSKLVRKNMKSVSKNPLNIPSDNYVKNKIKKMSKISRCSKGAQTYYWDMYGNKVRVGWCKGHSWPTSIHTDRFYAILKRIK